MRTRRFLYVTAGDSHEECDGCDRTTRRQFLGQVSTVAITAALASEFALPSAAALPVTEATGASAQADERTYPLPAADGVTIDRDAQIILVRYQNRVFAFGLACPHENTALRWRQQDSRFQCPRHESKYPTGWHLHLRAGDAQHGPFRRAPRGRLRRGRSQAVVQVGSAGGAMERRGADAVARGPRQSTPGQTFQRTRVM